MDITYETNLQPRDMLVLQTFFVSIWYMIKTCSNLKSCSPFNLIQRVYCLSTDPVPRLLFRILLCSKINIHFTYITSLC